MTTVDDAASQAIDQEAPATPPVAHPRRRLIFAVVSTALCMAAVDQTVVATALPELQADLGTSLAWAAWTLAVAGLGRALMMPTSGVLSDRFGDRRIFLISVVVFAVGSLGCALAGNIWVLIALRAVQALGAGAFVPSVTAIVARHFGADRDRAIGFLTSIFPIGAIAGPVIGGLCIAYWSWRAIFLINIPISIVLIGLCLRYVTPAPRAAHRAKPLDSGGLVLFGAAILSGMVGISVLSGADRTSVILSSVFLACSISALVTYWARARSKPNAFIALDLVWGRGFGTIGLLNLLFGAGAIGVGTLVPLYARERYDIGPIESGLLLTARAIGTIAVAGLTAVALRRIGYRWPMYLGFGATAVGLIGTACPPLIGGPEAWLAVTTALTGVGFGLVAPASNNAAMQLAPDRIASVAGIRGMFRQTGSIAAISVSATAIAMSSDPALTHAVIFAAFGAVLLLALPAIRRVPDRRGSW